MHFNGRQHAQGFTLIELCIVMLIISLILQLMLPAISSAREAARRSLCENNLRQLALGVNMHLQHQKRFPTGGWGFRWAGDPDRGFTNKQPGGWMFNVLPYIEQNATRQLGKSASATKKKEAVVAQSQTVIPIFHCPSRRSAQLYPYVNNKSAFNAGPMNKQARSDYAASSGDRGCCGALKNHAGPESLEGGDEGKFEWSDIAKEGTGLIYLRSQVVAPQVSDGLQYTLLVAERFVNPTEYDTGFDHGDDQGWNVGFDEDNCRSAQEIPFLKPQQDNSATPNIYRFGSAHPLAFGCGFADGTVRQLDYKIDPKIFASLANRKDGENPNLEEL